MVHLTSNGGGEEKVGVCGGEEGLVKSKWSSAESATAAEAARSVQEHYLSSLAVIRR